MSGNGYIAIVDYGAGNVPSVERALHNLGANTRRSAQPEELRQATAIVLPGVGNYAAIIRALDEHHLRDALLEAIQRGVPVLGICLGLQALYSCSDEAPSLRGLEVFPEAIPSLPETVKLPHMGWNQLRITRRSRLLEGIEESEFFYFAHSFAAPNSGNSVVATCEYGVPFAAAIEHGNIFATQFHPEKSGPAGARLLQNFLKLAK